jgi:ER lumen protein retaining receptor
VLPPLPPGPRAARPPARPPARARAPQTGISLKTQELYLLVFLTRYLDLFFRFYSVYNTSMKLFYILASGAIVYALRVHRGPWRVTYEQNTLPEDKMAHWLLCVAPCAVLALMLNEGKWADLLSGAGVLHYLFEACWAFSEYLEAVAVLPQLVLVTNAKSAENITAWYLLSLGAYRALYLANWVYRYRTEKGYWALISWVSGTVQTLLYADFVYLFVTKRNAQGHMILPS